LQRIWHLQSSNLTVWNRKPLIISWTHRSRELSNRGSNFIGLSKQGSHLGPSSTKVFPFDGGTQCNGYHYFLRGKDQSRSIPLAQSTIFHFGKFSTFFWVLKFRGCFESLNNIFWAQQCQQYIEIHGIFHSECVILIYTFPMGYQTCQI
jgi:hypothetical protein